MSGTDRGTRRRHGRAVASSPWIVVFAGVVVMVVLLVIVLSTYRGRSDSEVPRGFDIGAPMPTPPWLSASPTGSASAESTGGTRPPSMSSTPTPSSTSAAPTSSASASSSATAAPPGSPSATPSPQVSNAPQVSAAPPAPPTVSGRYRVNSTFSGGFIGEVRVSNVSGSAQGWEVRLEFSGGRVTSAWVMNASQGRLREQDGSYTYTGGADLAPDGSARLMFVVERADTHPVACSVNGVTCGGL